MRHFAKLWPATFAATLLAIVLVACTATQQLRAYQSLAATEQSVTAAIDAYDTLVVAGTVGTNDVPRVAKAYDTFQASFRLALDAAQFNTNAIAPPHLATEAQDLISLISQIRKDAAKNKSP